MQRVRLYAHRLLPQRPLHDAPAAAAFVRERRVVMAAGRSSLPALTEAIVGHLIAGSWMADPEVHLIHDVALALSERHEFVQARLVLGKRVLFVSALGPAVARIAADPARVATARRSLTPLARKLLVDTEARGQLQLDTWNAGSRDARGARLELVRALLVASQTVHTAGGRHSTVVRPWARTTIARSFARPARRLSYEQACEALVLAAVRSAVVVPERELAKWFVFPVNPDMLVENGKVRSLQIGRTRWLADPAV